MADGVGNFDSAHLYVQWGGKLPGGEIWSCGFRLANTTAGAGASYATNHHTAITNAIKAYHADTSVAIATRCLLSFVKMNIVGVDGKYQEQNTHEQLVPDLAGGGGSGVCPANQITAVVSLLTQYSRGPAHRGRFYSPLPTQGVGADGLILDGGRNGIKLGAETLRTAVNAADSSYKMAVFSRKANGATHNLVTAIAVGKALDTQRRRRNALKETY